MVHYKKYRSNKNIKKEEILSFRIGIGVNIMFVPERNQ
jgi:hypothetical protein